MLPITQDLLTSRQNRPALRDETHYAIRQLKGVVAHWTANTHRGAHAKANRNYFNTTNRFASAHYIVDDGAIIQCIPDNEVAYHVGGARYMPDGTRIMAGSGLTPNYYLIGFEMCVNSDGDWDKTYRNSAELAARLLHKYRFSPDDLYRHYDITGKDCPKMMLTDESWSRFKRSVKLAMANLESPPLSTGIVTSSGLNVRSGPGVGFPVQKVLRRNDPVMVFEVKDGWLRIGGGHWVSGRFVQILSESRLAVVGSKTGANVRSGAGMQFPVIDALPYGVLADVLEEQGNWYRLGNDRWAHQSVLQIVSPQSGTVTGTSFLNVRKGPGTNHVIVRRLEGGNQVRIFEESNNWYRIGIDEWVYSGYITKTA